MKKKWLDKLAVMFVVALIFCTFVACGEAADSYYANGAADMAPSMKEDYAYSEEASMDEAFGVETGATVEHSQVQDTSRKLIKTVSVEVETKEFDDLLLVLQERIEALGGYIESMDNYNGSMYSSYRRTRYAYITARIPADKLKTFMANVEEHSNITQRNEQVEDITLTYVDIESRKEMLRAEEKRLLAYLDEAETIEEIITIEDRLTDIRYELESIESRLRTFDNKVNYSTVDIRVNEVEVYTPPEIEPESTWERMVNGFLTSLSDVLIGIREFFIGFVIILPQLILLAIVVVIIVFAVKAIIKGRKKNAGRRYLKQQKRYEQQMKEYEAQYGAVAAQNPATNTEGQENTTNE